MIDGTAFEHEVETADGSLGKPRNVVANDRVVGKIVFATPAVGLEAKRDGAITDASENRARVAQPDVAVLRRNDFSGIAESGVCRSASLFTVGKKANLISCEAQRADECCHIPARRFEIAVPFVGVCRPCGPNHLLGRPFGGRHHRHAVRRHV